MHKGHLANIGLKCPALMELIMVDSMNTVIRRLNSIYLRVLGMKKMRKEVLKYLDDVNTITLERIEMTEASLMYEINEIKARLDKLEDEINNK